MNTLEPLSPPSPRWPSSCRPAADPTTRPPPPPPRRRRPQPPHPRRRRPPPTTAATPRRDGAADHRRLPTSAAPATTTTAPTAGVTRWRRSARPCSTASPRSLQTTAPHPTSPGSWPTCGPRQPPPPFDAIRVPSDAQPAIDEVAAILDQAAVWSRVRGGRCGRRRLGCRRRPRTGSRRRQTGQGSYRPRRRTCDTADPGRAQAGALNVPTEGNTFMINAGFGSIWASQTLSARHPPRPGDGRRARHHRRRRRAAKLQAADGRMWVRTADRYVAIDPATDSVAATLDKSAVGPSANRSFAIDGAMWICDGRRLHRYDPTTLQPSPPSTSTSTARRSTPRTTSSSPTGPTRSQPVRYSRRDLRRPASNHVLATVALPVDLAYPAVLDDAVFFPGQAARPPSSSTANLGRHRHARPRPPDQGRPDGDGRRRIYAPPAGYRDVG